MLGFRGECSFWKWRDGLDESILRFVHHVVVVVVWWYHVVVKWLLQECMLHWNIDELFHQHVKFSMAGKMMMMVY